MNLKLIKGKQTVETVMDILDISRQSAINLLSKLKNQGFVTTSGGGRQKRIYTITEYKQIKPKIPGMFDIISKHSKLKIMPYFKHVPHSRYTTENALIDAIKTKRFRIILASLSLFNHVTGWKLLYFLAKKNNLEAELGFLYDLSRLYIKTRKMPLRTYKTLIKHRPSSYKYLTQTKTDDFKELSRKWHIHAPFSKKDMEEIR